MESTTEGAKNCCPKCFSTKGILFGSSIFGGAKPLQCLGCGWSWLNEFPCQVCGRPSTSSFNQAHRCSEHPLTQQEKWELTKPFRDKVAEIKATADAATIIEEKGG